MKVMKGKTERMKGRRGGRRRQRRRGRRGRKGKKGKKGRSWGVREDGPSIIQTEKDR